MKASLELTGLTKVFDTPSGAFVAVKDVNLTVADGEFVALLGHSGCGKSTVLSMIAGLQRATFGGVVIDGTQVVEPGVERTMVFQSPCLLPWLTARENVLLAAAQRPGSTRQEQRAAADRYLDLVGIANAADQPPKELSLGTQQCVSLARALVVEPRFLLLDEPFSQLDVLTGETLRHDLHDLWIEKRIPTKSIVMVSHNIEEAVEMADRILIFSSDPGRISAELSVRLGRPREVDSAPFRQVVDQVYTLLTTVPGRDGRRGAKPEPIGVGYRLPDASVQQISGLLERLVDEPYHGRADLPHLADEENLDMDELFPLLELLQLLGFAHVSGGDVELNPMGRSYAEADMEGRKRLFADAVLKQVPIAAHIRRVLDERPGHRAPAARFLRELEDHLSEEEAQRVLDTVINWGRHAEIFAYDDDEEVLSLEDY